jgi:hypothetical protein
MGGGWTDLIWYNFVLSLPNCPQSITLLYHLFGKNLFFLLNNLDRETNRYIGREGNNGSKNLKIGKGR